ALHAASLTAGDSAGELRALASGGAGAFLLACVALPSPLGVLGRRRVVAARLDRARPPAKLGTSVGLLLPNYRSRPSGLPQAAARDQPRDRTRGHRLTPRTKGTTMNHPAVAPRPLPTRCVWSFLASAILAAPAALAAEPRTLGQVQTIPLKGVEGRLDHLGLD